MLKTIATPTSKNFQLELPTKYIGKKIEILVYAIDELIPEKKASNKERLSIKFRGLLTKQQGKDLNNHVEQMRSEWNAI